MLNKMFEPRGSWLEDRDSKGVRMRPLNVLCGKAPAGMTLENSYDIDDFVLSHSGKKKHFIELGKRPACKVERDGRRDSQSP